MKSDQTPSRTPDCSALEARILYSVSPLGPLLEKAHGEIDYFGELDAHALTPDFVAEELDAFEAKSEIVFIDASVKDYDSLVDDLQESNEHAIEIVLLDESTDGIAEISETLQGRTDVDSVHIVSHGDDGVVYLGNTKLSADTLDRYAGALASWHTSLSADADVLFYGCDLAASEAGEELIEELALLTGADVAASDDVTGHEALGGDWVLEYTVGNVSTDVAIGYIAQSSWWGTLGPAGTFSVDTLNDVNDGDTSSVTALLGDRGADGFISLREALIASNNSGGGYTINLGAGLHELTLTGSGNELGDFNISDNVTIVGAGSGETTITGNDYDRVFYVSDGIVDFKGLTIRDGNSTSTSGGSLFIDTGATVDLEDVIVDSNSANGVYGAGIHNVGTLTITDSWIKDNANSSGIAGGLYNDGAATLTRVLLSGNTAASGTGGAIYNAGNGSMTLTNVTFSGNTAPSGLGGAINTEGTLTIVNSTFADNENTTLRIAAGTTFVQNSIFANVGQDISGTITSLGNNIVSSTSGATGFVASDHENVNPNLAALADNGGSFHTHALNTGSVAIDGGNNTGAPSDDQRGYERDSTVDIGAFELNGLPPSVDPTQTVPGAQTIDEDTTLTFTSGTATEVSVSDTLGGVDSRLRVTLSIENGVLNLAQLTGLTMIEGSNGSGLLIFDGTESDINAALDGMTFTPNANFNGSVTLDMATDVAADLVGHYTFESSANDQSAGVKNNGTMTDGAAIVTDPVRGKVLDVSGTDDEVTLLPQITVDDEISISAWINVPATTGDSQAIVSLGNNIILTLKSDGSLLGRYRSSAGSTWNSTVDSEDLIGTGWRHVTYTVNTATNVQRLYIDGIVAAETNFTEAIFQPGSGDHVIGRTSYSNSDQFNGLIDDVRIYSRAISAEEGTALAKDQTVSSNSVAITVDPVNDAPTFNGLGLTTFGSGNTITNSADTATRVITADVDGDGDLDVLSASRSDNTFAWFENDGNQSFTQHVITSTADAAYDVSAADLDGDGDLDVLAASRNDDTIAWYENDGNQNFTQRVITNTADGASSVIAVDMDGDGDLDVVTASANDDTVAWYENDGSETFTQHVITTTADSANCVVTVDVDGDGDLDVISAAYGGDEIAWYENDGSQSFTKRVITNTLNYTTKVSFADLDGDGDVDILSTSQTDDSVVWFENNGSQVFTERVIANSANGAFDVIAADMDGDGDLDVVSALLQGDAVTWYENDGSETFTARVVTNSVDGAASVAVADVDGDGDLDVFSASRTDDTIAWYENQQQSDALYGLVSFTEDGPAIVLDSGADISDAELDALNGGNGNYAGASLTLVRDGGASSEDVLGFNAGNGITLASGSLIKNGQVIASFDTATTSGELAITFTDANTETPTSADVDNILRQITYRNSNDDPPASLQINWTFSDGNAGSQGSGGASQVNGITTVNIKAVNDEQVLATNTGMTIVEGTTGTTITTAMLQTTDVDNSNADLVYVISSLPADGSLRLNGTALELNETITQADIDAGKVTYDHNGSEAASDGFGFTVDDGSDAKTSATFDVTVTPVNDAPTFVRQGPPDFATDHAIDSTADGANSVAFADLDGDGDLDVVSASYNDDTIAWYENDGSQGYTKHVLANDADYAWRITTVDLDENGEMDVVATSVNDGTIWWFYNDGEQTFYKQVIGNATNPSSMAIADVDGDGDLDAIFTSLSDDMIGWYENDGSENFTLREITDSAYGAYDVTTADVDGDGDLDLIAATHLDDTIAWYENDGNQAFTMHVISNTVDDANNVTVTDVDGDGDLDVLSASGGDHTIAWYENDGSQSFTKRVITNTAYGAFSVATADVDGDGDLDVLSASRADQTVAWYENDGSQSFTKRVITDSANGASDVKVADIDGDGDLDVLSSSAEDDTIAWYEHQPVSADTLGGTVTFIEGGAAVVLDSDVDIRDDDLDALNSGDGNYDGASIAIFRSGIVNADDVFGFNDGNGITLVGGNLVKNGQSVGTFDQSEVGKLTILFSSAAGQIPNSADVDNILSQITYSNSNNTPPASVELAWGFHDGNTGTQGSGGALQTTGHTTVNITATNDAPIIVTGSDFDDGSNKAIDFEGDNDGVDLSALPVNTNAGSEVTVEFWMHWDGSNSMMPFGFHRYNLYFSADDFGFNTANSDVYGISTAGLANGWHHVAAVFHNGDVQSSRLLVDGVEQTLTQRQGTPNNTHSFATSNASISGWGKDNGYRFDGQMDGVRIWNGGRTEAQVQALMHSELTGPHENLVAAYSFTGATTAADGVIDDSGNGHHGTMVGMTAANVVATDFPKFGDLLFYTENDDAVVLHANVALTDYDDTDLTGATVHISGAFASGEDVLAFTNQNGITGTWNATNGTLTLTGTATIAQYETALQSITYENTSESPSTSDRTVSWSVTDGDDTSVARTSTIRITPVEDAPVLTNLASDSSTYSEGDGAVVIEQGADAAVTDADSSNFDGGTLTVSFLSGSDSAEDVLSIANVGTGTGEIGISGSNVTYEGTTIGTFTGGSGGIDLVVTFNTNATPAAASKLIQQITYENTDNDNPTEGSRTISFTVTDGDGETSVRNDVTLSVSRVNDEQNLAANTGVTVAEGARGTTITTAMLETTDGDNTDAELVYTIDTAPASGSLRLRGTQLGLNDTFTQADIDAGDVKYDHDGSETTSGSFDFTVDDGAGVTTSATFNVTVTPVNDAPAFFFENPVSFGAGHTISTTADGANSVEVVDVDDDGDLDVLAASYNDDTIAWYENDGDQGFTKHVITSTADYAYSVTSADVDGDGDLDVLAASSFDDTIAWYENDGNQNFTKRVVTSTANGAASVTTADVDGDGDLDVLSASFTDDTIAWYENDGNQSFTKRVISNNADGTFSVAVADVDGDGDLDVLSASVLDGKIAWYENDGNQVFTQRVLTNTASGTFEVATADVDGDGDLDVLSASQDDDTIAWYENDGSQTFTKHVITSSADGAVSVTTADMDGDGDLDVLSASKDDDSVAWYENDGSETFTRHVIADTADGAADVTVADVDGDGDLDVVTASRNDDTITWYENQKFSSILAGTVSFTEDGAAVVLDSDVEIRDDDLDTLNGGNGNYAGASLTLARNGGASSEDVLSFSAGGGITLAGGSLIKNGQVIATFDTTTTSGQLVITFTDANTEIPTSADVDNILKQITYSNSSNTPPTNVQIDWAFNDGNTGSQGSGGDLQATGNTTVNITASNDEQNLATNTGVTVAEGSIGTTITTAMLQTTDVDNTDAQLVYTVTGAPANGTLKLNGVDLALNDTFTQADIDAGKVSYDHNGGEAATDSFDFSVDDGAGTATSATFNLTITAVNDAPVNTVPGAQSVDEDTSVSISGISVNDVDDNLSTVQLAVNDGTLNVTLSGSASISAGANDSNDLTLSGSLIDINATLASLTYQGNLNFNGSDTLTVLSTDSDAATDSDTVAIAVGAINDDPVNAGTLPSDVAVTEDALSNVDLLAIDFSDVDAAGSDLTVTLTTSTGGELTLAADANLTFGGTATARTITGSVAELNAYFDVASNVQYVHGTQDTFGDNADTIQVVINDNGNTGTGGGTDQALGTVNVDITASNDEQNLATNTGVTVAEGSIDTTITTAMLQTTDVDNTDTQLVYTVTGAPANGTLKLNGVGLGLNDTFTQADIDSGKLSYDHNGGEAATDSFDFSVDDGAGTATSATFNLTITAVNDAPVNNLQATQSVVEDGTLEFSLVNGNTISVNDVDSGTSDIRVTLTVTNGVFNLAGTTGLTSFSGDGSTSVTIEGSNSAIFAALNGSSFVPTANYNGAATLTMVTSDLGNTGSGGAQTDTDIMNITVTAVNDAPVLDDSGNMTLTTINEDDTTNNGDSVADIIQSAGGDRITDVDGPAEGFAIVGSTYGNGDWEYSIDGGTNWNSVSFVDDSNALLLRATDRLRFVPNETNSSAPTLTVRAWDQSSGIEGTRVDANATGGATAFSAGTETVRLSVTEIADVPVITNLASDTQTYNEGDGAIVVDKSIDAVVTDVDSSNFDTGTLTVSFEAGSDNAEDVLAIANQGTGSGQIGVSGSDVTYEGAVIGTFTGGGSGSDLVITFDADANPVAVSALVQAITYENTDTSNPTAGDRTIRFVLTDGDGGTGANYDTTITVAAGNDAPVLDNTGAPALPTITEDDIDNSGMTVADLLATGAGGDPITDVDGNPEGIAITQRSNGRGLWEFSIDGGANWASVGPVAESSALLLRSTDLVRFNPNGENAPATDPTFVFRAWDQSSGAEGTYVDVSIHGGSTAFSTATETASITVTDVNDAPLLDSSGTVTLDAQAEDAGAPVGVVGTVITDLVSIGGNVSEVDANSQTGIAITAADVSEGTWWYTTDSGVSWNQLGNVSESSARVLNANSNTRLYLQSETDFRGTVTDAITFRAWDHSEGTNGSLQDTTSNGGMTAYSTNTETADITIAAVNDAPQLVGPSVVTNGTFDSGLSGWTATGNVDHDGIQVRFGQVGGANGTLSQTLATEVGKTYVVTFDYGDSSGITSQSLDVNINGSAALSDISLATGVADNSLQTYQYTFVADSTATTITFSDTSSDHSGVRGYLDNVSVATDATPNTAIDYVEGDGAVVIDNTLNIDDIDDPNIDSAIVSISGNYANGEDVLAFVDQNGITGAWNSGSGTLTLSGSTTLANYETALRSITFENNSEDPSTATRTVSFTVNDGDANSNTQTRDINVSNVNDAPTTSITAVSPTFTENGGPVGLFSSAALDLIEFADLVDTIILTVDSVVDGHSERIQVDGTQIALTDLNSETSLANGYDVVVNVSGSTATLTITKTGGFSGSDAENLINGLTYSHVGDVIVDGTRDVTFVSLTDDGGGSDTDSNGTVSTVTIQGFNDDPTNAGSLPSDISVTEDVLSYVDFSSVNFSDLDGEASDLTVTLSTSTGGELTLAADPSLMFGGTATARTVTGTLADLNNYFNNASSIQYLHSTAHTNGDNVDTITVVINDNGNTGTGGGTDQTLSTVNVDISAVNDAPVNTIFGTQTVAEETTTAISGVSISDLDAASGNVTAQLQVTAGVLDVTLSGTASISAGTNGTADLTILGSLTDVNDTLATLTYTGNTDVVGISADTLTVTTNDLGNIGSGGAQTDVDTIQIDVSAVNDTPDVSAPATDYTVNEQTDLAIEGTGFSVADVDASTGSMTATISVGEGAITIVAGNSGIMISSGNGGSTVVLTGTLTQIDNLLTGVSSGTITYNNGSDTPSASTTVTLNVNDEGNTGSDPGTTGDAASEEDFATCTIHITAVNDTPDVMGPTSSYLVAEDASLAIHGTGFRVTDADAVSGLMTTTIWVGEGTITVVEGDSGVTIGGGNGSGTVTVMGSLAQIDNLLTGSGSGTITYFNETDTPAATTTITVRVNDGGSTGIDPGFTADAASEEGSASQTITLTDSNDAPVIMGPNLINNGNFDAGVTAWTTSGGISLGRGGARFGELNTPTDGVLSQTFATEVGRTYELVFEYADDMVHLDQNMQVQVDGSGTLLSQTLHSSIAGQQYTTHRYTFTADSTASTLSFTDLSSNSVGVDSYIDSVVVSRLAKATYTENGAPVVLDGTIQLEDRDDVNLQSASIQITDNYANGEDVLRFTDQLGITSGWDASTGTLSLTGNVRKADWETALRSVAFENTSDNSDGMDRTITWKINDGTQDSVDRTSTVQVIQVNDDPMNAGSLPTSVTATEELSSDVNLSAVDLADVDARGNSLTVTLATSTGGTLTAVGAGGVTIGGSGTTSLTLHGDIPSLNAFLDDPANVQYRSTFNAEGHDVDSIQVSATDHGNTGADGGNTISLGDVSVHVTNVNDAPVAVTDTYSLDEGATLTISTPGLLGNDTDADGDSLLATWLTDPTNGTLTLNGNGSFVYTHDGSETTSDSFFYTVSDGQGGADTAVVNLFISAVNDAPTTVADSYQVREGEILIVETDGVLQNDSDAEGDSLSATVIAGPSNGTVQLDADGKFTYTHDGSESWTDQFTYQADDGHGGLTTETVSITILPGNDAPTSHGPGSLTTMEDTPIVMSAANGNRWMISDSDVGNELVVVRLSSTNGNLTLGSTNALTFAAGDGTSNAQMSFAGTVDDINTALDGMSFTPDENFHGDASIELFVDDQGNIGAGPGLTAVSGTSVTVLPVNDAPMAVGEQFTLVPGQSAVLMPMELLLANDMDVDGDELSIVLANAPQFGTVSIAADGSLIYVPRPHNPGVDSFSYFAMDSSGATSLATVQISVLPIIDMPGPTAPDPPSEQNLPDEEANSNPVELETISAPAASLPITPNAVGAVVDVLARSSQTDGAVNVRNEIRATDNPSLDQVALNRTTDRERIVTNLVGERFGMQTREGHAQLRLTQTEATDHDAYFLSSLENISEQVHTSIGEFSSLHYALGGAGAAASIGYVMWSIRSGYFFASMLASMPIWSRIDPLPVVDFARANAASHNRQKSSRRGLVDMIAQELASGTAPAQS